MISKFSLDRMLEELTDEYGVPRVLAKDFEKCKARGKLSSNGEGILTESIRCVIAGHLEPVDGLLSMAERFLSESITQQEPANLAELATVHRNIGLCKWLAYDAHDEESFDCMENCYRNALEESLDTPTIEMIMLDLVAAEQWDAASRFFKQFFPAEQSVHMTLASKTTEMLYRIASTRGYSNLESTQAKVVADYLKKNVPSLLFTGGHYKSFALWMKIVGWQHGLSSTTALRSCIDWI